MSAMSGPALRAFAKGYQEALEDVLAALESGGEEAAREWIANNLRQQ